MKRLIDADALYKEVTEKYHDINAGHYPFNIVAYDMAQLVKNAPTIDAVVLPCKIGDTVWAIRNYRGTKHPQQGRVSEMFFTTEMKLHIVVSHISRGEWGKTIFATREEAEAALAERKI